MKANQVDPGKTYLISGSSLRDLIEEVSKAKVDVVEGTLSIKKGPDGTTLGFANEKLMYGVASGSLAAWMVPARANPTAPGLT